MEAQRGKGSRNVSSPREFLVWKATNFPIFPGKLDYPPPLPSPPFLRQRSRRSTSLKQHNKVRLEQRLGSKFRINSIAIRRRSSFIMIILYTSVRVS